MVFVPVHGQDGQMERTGKSSRADRSGTIDRWEIRIVDEGTELMKIPTTNSSILAFADIGGGTLARVGDELRRQVPL